MYQRFFPNLDKEGYAITSAQTPKYNCIAWAAGDNTRFWWPDTGNVLYWPEDLPRNDSLEVFIIMFNKFKYVVCDNAELEENFEKIAIYVKDGVVTHAARQLSNGKWTSKLGQEHDIEHTLSGLDGPCYGKVAQIMKRSKAKN